MAENIFLFVPNLIGYARALFAFLSFFYMLDSPTIAMLLYWTSAFLDAFDGLAARQLNQSTIFGGVLDMVLDRCTTLALMMTCAHFYSEYAWFFQSIAFLDITSHWMQMYSSLLEGRHSHKFIKLEENPVMRFYYKKPILFSLCSFNELFFMSLYFHHFNYGPSVNIAGTEMAVWDLIGMISLPFFALKHFVSVVQLVVASKNIGAVDVTNRAKKS